MPHDEKISKAKSSADYIGQVLLIDTHAVTIAQLTQALSLTQVIKGLLVETLYEKLYEIQGDCINWLEQWSPFNFNGLTQDEITEIKSFYTQVVKDAVEDLGPSPLGVKYRIVKFEWRQTSNPGEYKLFVCLNPPVDVRGPGGPGSTIDPAPPGKP